ncbi:nucleotide exchange factor GrpE [Acetohalobium arabaticum]|uniref:Protein GrpE n=1 Tax=Acetohalobium arabaticum (strain ATCC 49924 / DSM 5501 / Z-7288) TaxID=574087 RepID=D9QV86_ACEAZ|nr:nucleotide exchange factor GrpE [Acetohalobium arabaticum]ADL12145.1 GrpE protein [Acetohalobium arabaticum DSM 5501]
MSHNQAAKKEFDFEEEKKEKEEAELEDEAELESEEVTEDSVDEAMDEELEVSDLKEQIEDLEKELERSEQEKEEYINKLQRQRADFSNYKNRVKKEKDNLKENATKELVSELLPILDNFERALASSAEDENLADFMEGMEMISRQLVKVLQQEGLEEISTVGEEFDPNLHEAVAKEPSEEYESGIVIEELQKGYSFNGQVLRAAMIKVAE